ncbi:sugar transferase [Paenibacillus segetis]|uniref:Sugar transferase n=1 Tax=Paenibacillus segetis TaxID=1325360 RepID=A0ABQ1YUC5_9BACL|nr:sugar transferase [Paenibacillus segetis]GGH37366.1 sugar transferase [Paenibacillus segetis]
MIKLFRKSGMKVILLTLDCLLIYVSYVLAYELRYSLSVPFMKWDSFFVYAPWLGLFTILTYYCFNLYDFAGRRKPSQFLFNLIIAQLFVATGLIVLNYWMKSFILPRRILLIAIISQLFLSFSLRLVLFYIQSKVCSTKKALVILNDRNADADILQRIFYKGTPWFRIGKIVTLWNEPGNLPPANMWEDRDLKVLLLGQGISPWVKSELIRLAGARNMEVVLIPEFYELYLRDAEPQQIDDLLVYSIMPPQLNLLERCLKRLSDLVMASLLLVITSPIMIFMFIVIPMTSKGKSLYVQERVGLHEKPFHLFKFRSMVDNAEAGTGPVLAGEQDARITRLGQFIRATRIDELPQLFNVLLGDMSMVGPRPERGYFVEQFKEELPHYTYRLMVKPGLTGYAQVMANYSTIPCDKLRYDLMYIKRYSFLLDLKILFQTIRVVLQREQSKGINRDSGSVVALQFNESLGGIRIPSEGGYQLPHH